MPIKQISSMMEEPTYDVASKTLTITFKKGGTYSYPNFTEEAFKEFHSAPSWGKFYHSRRELFADGVRQVPRDEAVAAS